jgi:hypothetical protein
LGVDLYANGEPSLHVVPALADLPDEPEQPAEEQPPAAAAKPSAMTSWLPWAIAGAALAVAVVLAVVRFSPTPAAGVAPPAAAAPPQYPELVQTDEWRNWRKQVHEKLSVEKLSESALAEALTKLPARPESAAAALRRDQAIGDVLMGYQRVSDILWDRFGIDKQNFLGTGLSKPSTALANYGAAMVHEYLIKNIFADSKAIWMRTLDPVNDMRLTVSQLFENDPSSIDPKRKELEREIVQRIKDKDTSIPCVIRFARFDSSQNSRRLGLSQRRYVFASNLAEVWNLSIRDAANLSGYISPKGDTVFVWVFVPEHASEVAPATWDQVLNHLPMWLNEND